MSKHSCCSFFSYILLVCIVYEGSHFNNGKKRISHRRISSAVFFCGHWDLMQYESTVLAMLTNFFAVTYILRVHKLNYVYYLRG